MAGKLLFFGEEDEMKYADINWAQFWLWRHGLSNAIAAKFIQQKWKIPPQN